MSIRTVEIPEETYGKLERLLPELGFGSVDECVAFVLNSLLSGQFDHGELSEEEEREMRSRLADLGYM